MIHDITKLLPAAPPQLIPITNYLTNPVDTSTEAYPCYSEDIQTLSSDDPLADPLQISSPPSNDNHLPHQTRYWDNSTIQNQITTPSISTAQNSISTPSINRLVKNAKTGLYHCNYQLCMESFVNKEVMRRHVEMHERNQNQVILQNRKFNFKYNYNRLDYKK